MRWREQLLTSVRRPQVSRVLDCVSDATNKCFIGFFVMLRVDRVVFFFSRGSTSEIITCKNMNGNTVLHLTVTHCS